MYFSTWQFHKKVDFINLNRKMAGEVTYIFNSLNKCQNSEHHVDDHEVKEESENKSHHHHHSQNHNPSRKVIKVAFWAQLEKINFGLLWLLTSLKLVKMCYDQIPKILKCLLMAKITNVYLKFSHIAASFFKPNLIKG